MSDLSFDFSTQIERSEDVLVQCAISHRDEFEVSIYADIMKVVSTPSSFKPTKTGNAARRGIVTRFSPKSRKRMLEKLAMLRDASGGYFITLTYPGRFMWDAADVKRHVDTLSKAIERRFKNSGAFWRMELKERLSGESEGDTVPHFHILLFGVHPPSLAYMRRWISVTWSRIAAYPDSPPMKIRTQCEEITSKRHAASYASKYAAKIEDVTEDNDKFENCNIGWGRHWGVFGTLDLSGVLSVKLTGSQLIHFKRLVRSWLKSKGSGYAKRLSHIREDFGFSAFGLGDLSPKGGGTLFECTAMRMILAVV